MDGHPTQTSGRPRRVRPLQNVLGLRLDRFLAGQIEPHPVHVRLVDDVGREDLHDHALPLLQKRPGRGNRLLAVAGKNGRRNRNAIGVEEPIDVERIEPGFSRRERLGDDLARRLGVGRELGGHARRRLHQVAVRLDIAHEVHETADRIGLAAVIGNGGGVEGLGRAAVVCDPDGQHGLVRSVLAALLLHDADDGIGGIRPARRARSARSLPGWRRSPGRREASAARPHSGSHRRPQ